MEERGTRAGCSQGPPTDGASKPLRHGPHSGVKELELDVKHHLHLKPSNHQTTTALTRQSAHNRAFSGHVRHVDKLQDVPLHKQQRQCQHFADARDLIRVTPPPRPSSIKDMPADRSAEASPMIQWDCKRNIRVDSRVTARAVQRDGQQLLRHTPGGDKTLSQSQSELGCRLEKCRNTTSTLSQRLGTTLG